MSVPTFRPGFRFSPLDAVVLVVGGGGAIAAASVSVEFAVLAVVPVVHFFLFCNVFRIARSPELLWSGAFLGCVALRELLGVSWPILGAVVVTATTLVIWRETLKESYHGILWRRWNPELPSWWARHHSSR